MRILRDALRGVLAVASAAGLSGAVAATAAAQGERDTLTVHVAEPEAESGLLHLGTDRLHDLSVLIE